MNTPLCRTIGLPRVIGLAVSLVVILLGTGTALATIFDDDWKPPVARDRPRSSVPPAQEDTSGSATRPTSMPAPSPGPTQLTPPAASTSKAIPPEADRARSRKVLKEVFADKLKDSAPAARRALATALLNQVAPSESSAADQYVLVTAAVDAAEQGRSLDLAFRAIDLLASRFDVDALAAKDAASVKVMSAPDAWVDDGSNAQDAMEVEAQLVQEGDFVDARRVLGAVQHYAARSDDRDLTTRAQAATTAIDAAQRSWQSLQAGLVRLKASPLDPEANFAVGAYACFVQGQWDRGLPYLARGSNKAAKSAAVAERSLAPDAAAPAVASVANAWWDVAPQQPTSYRPCVLRHASDLYQRAVPNLSGLELGFAKKRIELAEREAVHAPAVKQWYWVASSESWTATDLSVTASTCYQIVANGIWRGSKGPESGPEGVCPRNCFAVLGPQPALSDEQKEAYYLGQHPRGALIARIGDERWTFLVGAVCRFVAPVGGKLSFKINDTDQPANERSGRVQVAVAQARPRWVNPDGTVEILGRLDAADTFHITPQGVFWVYGGSDARVGLHDGYFPTVINGTYWWPNWPNKDRTDTLAITDLWPRNPLQFRLVKVEAKRGHVKVMDQSRAEIVIQFADDGLGSSQVGCIIAVGKPQS
jgi:hypothetical protein